MTQLTITLRERERERIPNLILRIQLSGTCKLQYNMYKPMITKLHWQVLIIFTRWGIWYTKMTEGPKKVKEKKRVGNSKILTQLLLDSQQVMPTMSKIRWDTRCGIADCKGPYPSHKCAISWYDSVNFGELQSWCSQGFLSSERYTFRTEAILFWVLVEFCSCRACTMWKHH